MTADEIQTAAAEVCNTDCIRFYEGTCPYFLKEKANCPRIRQALAKE